MSRALRITVVALAAQLMAGAAFAQDAAAPDGKALFHEKCAMCHGPGGMGTGLLARRVQPAELEKRDNLNADYVFQYARRGLGNMPPIPPGEASDPQLRAIAAYLAAGPGGRK
ncbi:MAG: cytochrome c [Caulobacteraceae bacterium]